MLRYPTIFLMGPPGVGKTTISRQLEQSNFLHIEVSKYGIKESLNLLLINSVKQPVILDTHPSSEKQNYFKTYVADNKILWLIKPYQVFFVFANLKQQKNRILNDTKIRGNLEQQNMVLNSLISLSIKYAYNGITINIDNKDVNESCKIILNEYENKRVFDPLYFIKRMYLCTM